MMLRRVPARARGLVVSIHDVSPHTLPAVKAITEDLRAWGVGRISHLVVPDHHHRGRADADAEFGKWLRGVIARGDEAVAHGYYHERPARESDGRMARWITGVYTAGEGEFFDLSAEEAERRSRESGDMLRALGVSPRGFIAPAWLLGEEATRGVRAAGFEYTTRLGTVDDWRSGVTVSSQSLVYSVRAAWRRLVSLIWNEALAVRLSACPLVRLGLHPPDWNHPAIRAHARRCVARALATREAIPYDAWIDRQRTKSTGS